MPLCTGIEIVISFKEHHEVDGVCVNPVSIMDGKIYYRRLTWKASSTWCLEPWVKTALQYNYAPLEIEIVILLKPRMKQIAHLSIESYPMLPMLFVLIDCQKRTSRVISFINNMGGFQLYDLIISRVINHCTCYRLSALIWLKYSLRSECCNFNQWEKLNL